MGSTLPYQSSSSLGSMPVSSSVAAELSGLMAGKEVLYENINHVVRTDFAEGPTPEQKGFVLETNFYPLEIDPDMVVYHYDFTIQPEIKNKVFLFLLFSFLF